MVTVKTRKGEEGTTLVLVSGINGCSSVLWSRCTQQYHVQRSPRFRFTLRYSIAGNVYITFTAVSEPVKPKMVWMSGKAMPSVVAAAVNTVAS